MNQTAQRNALYKYGGRAVEAGVPALTTRSALIENHEKKQKKSLYPSSISAWLCVYGRMRCGMATNDVPPKKPRKYLWPAEAVNIAQKKQHPVRRCEELIALTGYDKAACWRFLKKHGVERPGSGSRRTFDPTTVESIIEYVSEHGVRAASQRFHCEAKTLYNLIHRRGYTHYSKDLLSLRQICSHFGVRYSKVMSWIEQGLLRQSASRRVRADPYIR